MRQDSFNFDIENDCIRDIFAKKNCIRYAFYKTASERRIYIRDLNIESIGVWILKLKMLILEMFVLLRVYICIQGIHVLLEIYMPKVFILEMLE